jgi:polyhydroxyalkanoate synthesis regulator protein
LLPITFLRQLIRFYGDSMQMLVPRYLEMSVENLTREQARFRESIGKTFGGGGLNLLEDQVRRNMEMFERAFTMFLPFAQKNAANAANPSNPASPTAEPAAECENIDDLKKQVSEMQKRLDRLVGGSGDKS